MLLAALIPFLFVGCTDKTPEGTPVDVTLKDFNITPAEQTVGTGDVVMRVHNDAPVTHEFVVVRTDLPEDGLPIAADSRSVRGSPSRYEGRTTQSASAMAGLTSSLAPR